MKNRFLILVFSMLSITFASKFSYAQPMAMVGGEAMYPSKDIVDNAVNSKDHTTLVAAVKAAGTGGDFKRERPVHGICPDKRRI
jgi:uncharacterized surface protein with fasciclin (FAS1) repeats